MRWALINSPPKLLLVLASFAIKYFAFNSFNILYFNVEGGTQKYVSGTSTSAQSQLSRNMASFEAPGLFGWPRYVINEFEPPKTPRNGVPGTR